MPIHGYPGNVITANPVAPTSTVATGVWTTEQQLKAVAAGNWPFTIPPYQISRSLRFNSADSPELVRTFGSAGNRKTWTWSGWVKRALPAGIPMFVQYTDGNNQSSFTLRNSNAGGNDDQIRFFDLAGGSFTSNIVWSPVYRDPSAWYHVMLVADTTQATNTDRIKLYVNGVQVTATTVATWPSQNTDLRININSNHFIGQNGANGDYASGYLTEINFIGGSALTPSSFGQTNASTGVWEPIAYTGSYSGTNSFYLNFSDNSNNTAATLGKDYSGNGNNWTPSNLSVTAGSGNDSFVDTPTPYGTDTGAGGTVRGNYCTMNPIDRGSTYIPTLANGNLQYTATNNTQNPARATLGVTTGKWYFEATCTTIAYNPGVGVMSANSSLGTGDNFRALWGTQAAAWYSLYTGSSNTIFSNGAGSSYATSFTANDIIMVAYDVDTGKFWVGKNGTWNASGDPAAGTNNAATFTHTDPIVPFIDGTNTGSADAWQMNFGQRAFAYTAPSGFKALCTQNLPTPTIGATSTTQADNYFNTALYTGNGNATAQAITGVGFQPDFVWLKARSQAYENILSDAVRGAGKILYSSLTNAEATVANFVSFDSDGFTVNANGGASSFNANGVTYASWNWNAGNSTVTNTTGSISAQVRASTTAGFSVVTFTGNGVAATVGHGLGVKPSMIITKSRSAVADWFVYHTSITANNALVLNSTAASAASIYYWANTEPTSSVFSLYGNGGDTNVNGRTYVAYCFAAVAGYSAFGTYAGNGSTDGPFIYTGFRPAYLMIKRSSASGEGWGIYDNKRDPFNITDNVLEANSSGAEISGGTYPIDMVSNGFKIRGINGLVNTSGQNYIYAAFAESPFKYALAR